MHHAVPDTPVASSPDPAQGHPANSLPNNIVVVLHAVSILIDYGRHLIDTVRQRAAAPNFEAIAACFGTANLTTILAHLDRGLLRCVALQRVLLARAASGRDIEFVARRTPPAEPQPAAGPTTTGRRVRRPVAGNDPERIMPTLEDLERQVRRRAIGRTIQEICLDLAVVPGFCHRQFWNELFDIMTYFGGSIAKLMREKARRQTAFSNQQDRNPNANWTWLNMSRDALRQVLGFFIGEPPVNPLDRAAAIATAPP